MNGNDHECIFHPTCDGNDFADDGFLMLGILVARFDIIGIQPVQLRIVEADAVLVGVYGRVVAIIPQRLFFLRCESLHYIISQKKTSDLLKYISQSEGNTGL